MGDNIQLTLEQGWTEYQGSAPLELSHSNPSAWFDITVGSTSASSAYAVGQQYISTFGLTDPQVVYDGSQSLSWTTFTQAAIFTVSGTVTSSQSSGTVYGEVIALLNPQTQTGAEISANASDMSNYSQVSQSVTYMVDSLAD